jgi:hypothetical protein
MPAEDSSRVACALAYAKDGEPAPPSLSTGRRASDQPLDITFWIDDEHRIRRIRIIGAIRTAADPAIARRVAEVLANRIDPDHVYQARQPEPLPADVVPVPETEAHAEQADEGAG